MNQQLFRVQTTSVQKWRFCFVFGICITVSLLFSTLGFANSDLEQKTLLIKFKNNITHAVEDVSATFGFNKLEPVFESTNRPTSLSLWYKITIEKNQEFTELREKLNLHTAIDKVILNSQFKVTSVSPSASEQLKPVDWSIENGNDVNEYRLEGIESESKIVVAVLDTGVDYTHEDLRNNMWVNDVEKNGADFVDDDNNGCVDDIYGCDLRSNVSEKLGYNPGLGGAFYSQEKYVYPDGMKHGTLVAGVIGAQQHNGIGIDGVSANVKIMSVKFINQSNIANMADAAAAIQYAVDNGAQIINNSYGKPHVDEETLTILRDAFEYAHDNGVLMIVSAGNSGVDIDGQHSFYPANLLVPNIITVNALDQDGLLWEASNYGGTSVDISAPGVAIWSTTPVGNKSLFRKYYSNSGYMQTEGTSIATPFVTGIAATIWAKYPSLSHLELKQLLLSNADPRPELQAKTTSGGKINMRNIINTMENTQHENMSY